MMRSLGFQVASFLFLPCSIGVSLLPSLLSLVVTQVETRLPAIARLAVALAQIPFRAMSLLKWKPTSAEDLEITEAKLLSHLKNPFKGRYVDIGPGWGVKENKVWTVSMESTKKDSTKESLPIVMLHGFGCGVGIWTLNLDNICANRKVYAIDLLGFGRSSRPYFSRDIRCEEELVDSIEKWRSEVGLDRRFILLGHSFGGYLSTAYALKYPRFVSHLILCDPWGIPSEQTAASSASASFVLPGWVKFTARIIFKFNPLGLLRVAGPMGPSIIQKVRPDLKKKFQGLVGEDDSNLILDYVYHCNAQDNPAGEIAFKNLAEPTGWAKNPMIDRITDIAEDIDITFIYGSRSWIDRQPGYQIKETLGDDRVEVHVIQGAGHHLYVDKLDAFNELVNSACDMADERNDALDEGEVAIGNLHAND